MKSFNAFLRSLIGDQIAEYVPGGPLLVLALQLLWGRKVNGWSAFWVLMTLALYVSWHVQLPKPYDSFNARDQAEVPRVTPVNVSSAKAVPVPDDILVPKPPDDLVRRRYRVANVPENDTLSVRLDADAESKEVGKLARDAKDIEIRKEPQRNGLNLWVFVAAGELRGWVNASFLEEQPENNAITKLLPLPGKSRPQGNEWPLVDDKLIQKLEYHCQKHFNKEGQWASKYQHQMKKVLESRVEFYDGKKAKIRLGYEFFSPRSGVSGKHQRIFGLRWTWGDYWQVESIGEPIAEPFPTSGL